MSTVEEIIRSQVSLPTTPSPKGWCSILCKVCNDHGKKGPRAGFRFNGSQVEYHCFNCGHAASYDGDANRVVPKNMKIVFDSFGISEDYFNDIKLNALKKGNAREVGAQQDSDHIPLNWPKKTKLPEYFSPIYDESNKSIWAEAARMYINDVRGISTTPNDKRFFICNDLNNKNWAGRVVIVDYFRGVPVSYFGRALVDDIVPKYRNITGSNDSVIYNYDELMSDSTKPLYIVEGPFDALSIGGVGILSNVVSKSQADIINTTTRRKIYIPDMEGKGWKGGYQALTYGWEISIPNLGNCKDMNEAVLKYGKVYVKKCIIEAAATGFKAELCLKILKTKDGK